MSFSSNKMIHFGIHFVILSQTCSFLDCSSSVEKLQIGSILQMGSMSDPLSQVYTVEQNHIRNYCVC